MKSRMHDSRHERDDNSAGPRNGSIGKRLWMGLLCLALLTPIGVALPRMFGAGGAWGEWGPESLERALGFVPEGLKEMTGAWKAPLADYGLSGGGMVADAVCYALSAFAGLAGVALFAAIIVRILKKRAH